MFASSGHPSMFRRIMFLLLLNSFPRKEHSLAYGHPFTLDQNRSKAISILIP